MKYHHLVLLCFAIFCTRAAHADPVVTITTNYTLHDPNVLHFSAKDTVELSCSSGEGGTIRWAKGDRWVTDVDDLKNRAVINENNSLTLKGLKESDAGNYTCVVTLGEEKTMYNRTITLKAMAKWGVKVPKNTNVVEDETLTVKCEVKGVLTLTWFYLNTTAELEGTGNTTEMTGKEPRWKLDSYYDENAKRNITNGELKVENVNMGDRGEYTCVGTAENGQNFSSTTTVRIKDKYAAVWPFLGICAEVFVLCAIIFIYEKKRNKTELDESDTDQSPDQKNTPDHGKESNLRHRQ